MHAVHWLRSALRRCTPTLLVSMLFGVLVGLGLLIGLGPSRQCDLSPCAIDPPAAGEPCLNLLVYGRCTITVGLIVIAIVGAIAAGLAMLGFLSWTQNRHRTAHESS